MPEAGNKLSNIIAICRAVFGVAIAGSIVFATVWLGNIIRKGISGGSIGIDPGPGSADSIERKNTSAIENLENALDILRRARGR